MGGRAGGWGSRRGCARYLSLIRQIAQQALHNKLRGCGFLHNKDVRGRRRGGREGGREWWEEGDPCLPSTLEGELKYTYLSGSCNKKKRVRRCRRGTNMKGSGGWRQGDGAPPEDWMKLSLYNQGASAWLPPPLPGDR